MLYLEKISDIHFIYKIKWHTRYVITPSINSKIIQPYPIKKEEKGEVDRLPKKSIITVEVCKIVKGRCKLMKKSGQKKTLAEISLGFQKNFLNKIFQDKLRQDQCCPDKCQFGWLGGSDQTQPRFECSITFLTPPFRRGPTRTLVPNKLKLSLSVQLGFVLIL